MHSSFWLRAIDGAVIQIIEVSSYGTWNHDREVLIPTHSITVCAMVCSFSERLT